MIIIKFYVQIYSYDDEDLELKVPVRSVFLIEVLFLYCVWDLLVLWDSNIVAITASSTELSNIVELSSYSSSMESLFKAVLGLDSLSDSLNLVSFSISIC